MKPNAELLKMYLETPSILFKLEEQARDFAKYATDQGVAAVYVLDERKRHFVQERDYSLPIIKIDMHDNFKCKCGNQADLDGFYPCNKYGFDVEPTPDWEGYYKCDRCKQVYLPTA